MAKLWIKRLPKPAEALWRIEIYINDSCVYKMANGEEKAFDLPVGKHSVYVKNIIPSNTLEFDLQENTEIKLVFSSSDSDRSQRRAIWIVLFATVLVIPLPGHFILFILISVIVYLLYMGITGRFLTPLNLRLESSQ